MTPTTVDTFQVSIFIAGDVQHAKQACREYCFEVGLCVTVDPTTYIYTGGEEAGIRVGLINYPRFPTTADELSAKAHALADLLMHRLCQNSYTIVTPDTTYWYSRRTE